ncbi:DUF3159 domain-containing protein [Mycolicibacterium frederiksbergense]|uniref:DUF3159 domain-containing protein n=1 Tax=Mycolicibacterium frederiksbergense TaxID=117567 RepID=UPI00265BFC27|nr:DUF3159 domain-containing protein [Mycolicibacterium frederiksbergense]MDO0973699.1 DUF3159 domain-containing protein [Mycolicibacterium frederiksbergense]
MRDAPLDGLLERAGGVRGLIYSALPVTTYAVTAAALGRIPAIIAALAVAALVLAWQVAHRESLRPALWGFAGVALCAGLALVTGQAKDFYLPGIGIALVRGRPAHRVDPDPAPTGRCGVGMGDGARRSVAACPAGAVGL